MKQLLAIDTTTEACSVALVFNQDGKEQRLSRYQLAPRRHAELILSMVDEVLAEAKLTLQQLDALAVTIGPGAFTGVRLGVAVAQGLAFSSGLKVIPINTLQALAFAAADSSDSHIAVAMDARMNEVYWGCFEYKDSQLLAITQQTVVAAAQVPLAKKTMDNSWRFAGTGWQAYPQEFKELLGISVVCNESLVLPTAESVLSLALTSFDTALEAELLLPLYLRDKVAETIIERQAKKQQ